MNSLFCQYFFVQLIKERKYDVTELEGKRIGKEEVKSYDIENLELIPLLFQMGYLTIKKIEGNKILVLGFSNNEVEECFYTELIKMLSDKKIGSPIISNLEFRK